MNYTESAEQAAFREFARKVGIPEYHMDLKDAIFQYIQSQPESQRRDLLVYIKALKKERQAQQQGTTRSSQSSQHAYGASYSHHVPVNQPARRAARRAAPPTRSNHGFTINNAASVRFPPMNGYRPQENYGNSGNPDNAENQGNQEDLPKKQGWGEWFASFIFKPKPEPVKRHRKKTLIQHSLPGYRIRKKDWDELVKKYGNKADQFAILRGIGTVERRATYDPQAHRYILDQGDRKSISKHLVNASARVLYGKHVDLEQMTRQQYDDALADALLKRHLRKTR